MMSWKINKLKSYPVLNNPVLVEGLPGIGNVGKVAVDFIIDELKAKKILEFTSYGLPHSVFVNDKNLVELPSIEIYCAKRKGKNNDLLFLTGDVQPVEEVSCYEFSEKVLDVFQSFKGKEIITLGGIGLASVPKVPKIYCTGNSRDIVKKYTHNTKVNKELYGVVGPIVGVSGVLLGLAKKRNINAVCLLAETIGHPMYLGIKGAREIIKILSGKLDFKLNLDELDKEIKEVESELMKQKELFPLKDSKLKRLKSKYSHEVSYIG